MAIKVGVVGMGRVAQDLHCPNIRQTEGFQLHAVCDTVEARRRYAEETYGVKTYADRSAFLADPELQLVVVATPSGSHRDIAVQVAQAGKHLVVEKPLAMSLSEADDIIAAAQKAGVLLTVHQNRRWDGEYLTIRKAIEDGLLGSIVVINSQFSYFNSLESYAAQEFHPRWRMERAYGGGAVYDWGPHQIDQVLQIVGSEVETVFCCRKGVVWTKEVDDYYQCTLRFASGVVANIGTSLVSRIGMPRWYIIGDLGTLQQEERKGPMHIMTDAKGLKGEYLPTLMADDWQAFYRHLYQALAKGAELVVKPAQVRKTMAIIDAAVRSAETGEAVRPAGSR